MSAVHVIVECPPSRFVGGPSFSFCKTANDQVVSALVTGLSKLECRGAVDYEVVWPKAQGAEGTVGIRVDLFLDDPKEALSILEAVNVDLDSKTKNSTVKYLVVDGLNLRNNHRGKMLVSRRQLTQICNRLPGLLKLNLDSTGSKGGAFPREVGNLGQLQHLNLANNGLKGKLPSEIGELRELRILDCSDNMLEGELPGALFQLPILDELYLGGNQFEGKLSCFKPVQKRLRAIDADGNKFSGPFPVFFLRMPNLVHLHFNDNNLEGRLPSVKKGAVAPMLREIALAGNQITEEIPASFSRLPALETLDLRETRVDFDRTPKAVKRKSTLRVFCGLRGPFESST